MTAEGSQAERLWSEQELAERWRLSTMTLKNWRSLKTGPEFIKIGRSALYKESDVLAWEAARAGSR